MVSEMKRLAVIGGGITGLAAAFYASRRFGERANITLFEREDYWGGKIITERVDGFVIEGGPDTFLASKPWAVQLCHDLGMVDRLRGTNPNQKTTYILHRDRLHPLPGGLTMMIPTRFGEILRSELISWSGKLRMGLEYLLPPAATNRDESIGHFVSRRLGRQAYEGLIEPLMSAIYAGDGDRLSVSATFPYLRELEQRYGGLIKGALVARTKQAVKSAADVSLQRGQTPVQGGFARLDTPGSRSLFLTPEEGLGEIVDNLVAWLKRQEVDMCPGSTVIGIEKLESGYRLIDHFGQLLDAEAVILAVPAFSAADLLQAIHPQLAGELRAIEYISTATVSLAFNEADLPRPLDGYGYVIPRREGRVALACTWTSTKFPHRAPRGKVLVRVFIGRAGQEGAIAWDEKSLLAIARAEVQETLGLSASPLLTRVHIWEKAMPQYNVGHLARLQRINTLLLELPDLALAGNAYQGIGLPDCIHSGEQAVGRVAPVFQEK